MDGTIAFKRPSTGTRRKTPWEVVVIFSDGHEEFKGGGRAERAVAVIVCENLNTHPKPPHFFRVYGLRSNMADAERAARSWVNMHNPDSDHPHAPTLRTWLESQGRLTQYQVPQAFTVSVVPYENTCAHPDFQFTDDGPICPCCEN